MGGTRLGSTYPQKEQRHKNRAFRTLLLGRLPQRPLGDPCVLHYWLRLVSICEPLRLGPQVQAHRNHEVRLEVLLRNLGSLIPGHGIMGSRCSSRDVRDPVFLGFCCHAYIQFRLEWLQKRCGEGQRDSKCVLSIAQRSTRDQEKQRVIQTNDGNEKENDDVTRCGFNTNHPPSLSNFPPLFILRQPLNC